MLLDARASFLNTFVLKAGDSMTGDLTFSGAFHPVVAPGSDTDADLLTVTVTGTPTLSWDETNDAFNLNQNVYVDSTYIFCRKAGVTVYPQVVARGISTNGYGSLVMDRALGTAVGGESAVLSGDILGYFFARGYDGSGYGTGAAIFFGTTENFDGSSHGGYMAMQCVANGSTSLTTMLQIYSNSVSVGPTYPAALLHVDQSSTTRAKPVLLLDQADIDQEFIRFVGSSEDGVADRSLVDAADMTTPGALAGWIQVYIEDIQGTNPITDGVYYVPFYAAPSA